MLPVANKPILEHLVLALKGAGITDIIMVVGYRHEMIRDYFRDGWRFDVAIEYIHQTEQRGTGHAVSLLEGHVSGRFLVLNGDILFKAKPFQSILADGCMAMTVNGKGVNAGIYLFDSLVFNVLDSAAHDLISALDWLGHHVSFAVHVIEPWSHLSHPWDLLTANESLNGSVILGQHCEIGPNCYIRPHTSIGDNCHIGAGVEVKNSIIMAGAKVPHLSYIGDSIIGENCNIGAGTVIANMRLDGKTVMCGGIDTGRRKLGAIIGDNVKIGVNCSIMPGVMLAPNSVVMPHTCVTQHEADIADKIPCAA